MSYVTELDPRPRRHAPRSLRTSVVEGPDAGRDDAWPPGEPHGVGVSPDNALVLTDPKVSRYHLELEVTKHGIAVRDLGSLNGTFVFGIRVERCVVGAPTRIRIGATVLVVDAQEATDAEEEEGRATIPGLVARSQAMQEVARSIAKLAPTGVSVLIQGETGTGKELVARAIHEASPRRTKPLVVVDCGSLPATLAASELFGHERGAFTGADHPHTGAFEQAHGGTIFLDEIGELPQAVQPVLLGVLERRSMRRLGGKKEIHVDVRVLSATNRDLRAEANDGTFRPDLFFRLVAARIMLAPLRQRPEDIEPLVEHFAQEFGVEAASIFDEESLAALRRHPWSGNIRELRNVVESASALGRIEVGSARAGAMSGDPPWLTARYSEARQAVLHDFEAKYLKALMERAAGNASAAARAAMIDRPYLLTLLRRHGLR